MNPGRWHRPLVLTASLAAVTAFAGWIAVLALTLPTRYVANHWNVAWVGFDVTLLVSLVATGWALARRRPWNGTAQMVSAVLLVCDAWFDVTTASGGATVLSVALAGTLELPAAAALAWTATRRTVYGSPASHASLTARPSPPIAMRMRSGPAGTRRTTAGPTQPPTS